jgi:hypothetical protein
LKASVSDPHQTFIRKDVPHLSESPLIGIEKRGLVESPGGWDLKIVAGAGGLMSYGNSITEG